MALIQKIKDGLHAINFEEYESIGIHWVALYEHGRNVTCFDRSGVEHNPKEN